MSVCGQLTITQRWSTTPKNFIEPFFRSQRLQISQFGDALEVFRERKIIAIKLAFVLDQCRFRQKIEVVDGRRNDVRLQRLKQRQKFTRAGLQAAMAEVVEKIEQNGLSCLSLVQSKIAMTSPSGYVLYVPNVRAKRPALAATLKRGVRPCRSSG